MKRIGVLASGEGTNLEAILKAQEKGDLSGRVVLTISDKAGARALKRAEARKIKALFLNPKDYPGRADYGLALAGALQAQKVDLVVLAGFMRLLAPEFTEAFAGRIMNIHPALLPAFAGLNGVEQALDYGVKVSGCTVHFVDAGLDTGPVILQEAVPVIDGDTAATLHQRIHAAEYRLYPRAIDLFCRDQLKIVGRRCIIVE